MEDRDYFNKVYSGEMRHGLIIRLINKLRYAFYKPITVSINKYKNCVTELASPNKLFLEIGIGADGLDTYLSEAESHVVAIDISDEAIKNAKLRDKKNVQYICMNAEQTIYDNDTFDVVYGKWILHHLNMDKIFAETSRIMKKDGKAIFLEPLGTNPFIRIFRGLTPSLRVPDEHPLLQKDLTLANEYFKVTRCEYYHFLLFLAPFVDAHLISRLEEFLLKKFSFLKMFCWQVLLILEDPKNKPGTHQKARHSDTMTTYKVGQGAGRVHRAGITQG